MNRLTVIELIACSLVSFLLLSAISAPANAEAQEPTRVATLLPFVGDALELAPDHAEVVAGVRRSMRAPLPAGLIDLGNPHSPSFERLAEARPDLIVGDRQLHAAFAEKLSALGAELMLIDTSGVETTLGEISNLAQRIGDETALPSQIKKVRDQIGSLALSQTISVLPLFGAPGSFYAVTQRAWLGRLLTDLGFDNVAPSSGDERYPGMVVVSDEILATLQPELIVVVAHGDPRKIRAALDAKTSQGGAWASLSRAEHGIHILDPALFSANPGLGLGRAASELVALGAMKTADSPLPSVAAEGTRP